MTPTSSADVLARICADTRAEVAPRKTKTSLDALRARIAHAPTRRAASARR